MTDVKYFCQCFVRTNVAKLRMYVKMNAFRFLFAKMFLNVTFQSLHNSRLIFWFILQQLSTTHGNIFKIRMSFFIEI